MKVIDVVRLMLTELYFGQIVRNSHGCMFIVKDVTVHEGGDGMEMRLWSHTCDEIKANGHANVESLMFYAVDDMPDIHPEAVSI